MDDAFGGVMADASDSQGDQTPSRAQKPRKPFLKRGEGVEKRLTAYQRRQSRPLRDDATSGHDQSSGQAVQARRADTPAHEHSWPQGAAAAAAAALGNGGGRREPQHDQAGPLQLPGADEELLGATQLMAPDTSGPYGRTAAAAGLAAAPKGLTPRGAAAVAATRASSDGRRVSFGEPSSSSPWEAREAAEAWELEEFRALEKAILKDTGGMRASVSASGQWDKTANGVTGRSEPADGRSAIDTRLQQQQQQHSSAANGNSFHLPAFDDPAVSHSQWADERPGTSAAAASWQLAPLGHAAQSGSTSGGQPLDFNDESEWVDAEVSFQGFASQERQQQQHAQQQQHRYNQEQQQQQQQSAQQHQSHRDQQAPPGSSDHACHRADGMPEQAFVRSLFKQAAPAKARAAQAAAPSRAANNPAAQDPLSGAPPEVLQRLQRLEDAEARSNQEKASLLRLRTDLERAAQRLEAERNAWEQQKADERASLDAAREDSERRLARERRVLDKQSKALLKLPNKKERDAVEALEAVLLAERKEARAAQARHKLTVERLRCQVKELQDKALELREEVRWHEARQLAAQDFTAGGKTRAGAAAMADAQCQTAPGPLLQQQAAPQAHSGPSKPPAQPPKRHPAVGPSTSAAAHANGNGWAQVHAKGAGIILQPASSSGTAESEDGGSGGAAAVLGELYAALFDGDEPYEDDAPQQEQRQQHQQQQRQKLQQEQVGVAPHKQRQQQQPQQPQQHQQHAERRASHAAVSVMPATSSFSIPNSTRLHKPSADPHAVSGQAPGAVTAAQLQQQQQQHMQQEAAGPLHGGTSVSVLHGGVAGRRMVYTVTLSPAKQGSEQLHTLASSDMQGGVSTSHQPHSIQPPQPSGPMQQQQHQQQQQQQHQHQQRQEDDTQPSTSSGPSLVREVRHTDGKVERHLSDGTRVVVFANGTTKTTNPAGDSAIRFANGDIKRALPGGKIEYFYAEVETWQTSYASGLEVYHFPSGQTEGHHPDGVKEIAFPDGAVRRVLPDGFELEITRSQLSAAVQAPMPTA